MIKLPVILFVEKKVRGDKALHVLELYKYALHNITSTT